jgi:zinc D-Ala-D-Ala carboxypeptidase
MAAILAVLAILLCAVNGCSQGVLHPAFTLNAADLTALTSDLPKDASERIRAKPQEFLGLMAKTLDEPQDLMQIVDKKNPLPKDYSPQDRETLDAYSLKVTKPDLSLRLILIPDLLEMSNEALDQGVTITIGSTYRSYSTQVVLYENALKTQSREEVERELAPPGHSQHQLGTTIDFYPINAGFAGTPAHRWLMANAWKFGFSLSYPEGKEKETGYSYEPWHYRYVGRPAAALIRDFFGGSQQQFLTYYAGKSTAFAKARIPEKSTQ